MKALIKFVVLLGTFFTFTFIVFKLFRIISADDIKLWLEVAMELSPSIVGVIIVFLMLIDLFIAIPTLSLTILSGFFLGVELGAFYSCIGMLGAGSMGYVISRFHGDKLLNFVTKDDNQKEEMTRIFSNLGFFSLMLCRAAPMLPEVTSCLAGVTQMPYWQYILFYSIGTIPYAVIAAYSGSISTVNDPSPAIFTFIGIFAGLSIFSLIFIYVNKHKIGN